MVRFVIAAVLATGCWSQTTRTADRDRAERLQAELAAAQEKVEILERRLAQAARERDDAVAERAALEARLAELETPAGAVPSRPPPPPPRPGPDPAKTYSIALGKWPQRGPADAKVTLVFVHDYACPHCERSRATLDDLLKKYGKDLRIVYRPYIVYPQRSAPSALAACAAARQNKYDKLEPLLWDKGFKAHNYDVSYTAPDGTTQPCWTGPTGCPVVTGFARDAGLDVRRFEADLPACDAEVKDSMKELTALGVMATPTFYINGRYLSGGQPMEQYVPVIDEEKRKADERIRKGTPKARYYQEWVVAKGEKTLGP